MFKKPIIVFEGIEGSGKSFHIKNVENYLKKNKIKYIKLREPGGSVNSEKIRNIILNKKSNFKKLTDLFLYMAARNIVDSIEVMDPEKKNPMVQPWLKQALIWAVGGLGYSAEDASNLMSNDS